MNGAAHEGKRRLALVTLVLAAVVVTSAGVRTAAAAELKAASSDDHLWFVARTGPPRSQLELRHHARRTAGPHYTRGVTLAVDDLAALEALAAWGNQLWLVLAPSSGDADRRETFTVQVQHNPALNGWYHEPHDRLRAVASLEGGGAVTGFAGTADGPVALVLQRGSPAADGPAARLLQLRGGRWQELPAPPGLRPGPWRLGAAGAGGRTLVLVGPPPEPGGPATVYRLEGGPEGTWAAGQVPVASDGLRELQRVGPNLALVLEGTAPEPVRIAYLRSERVLPLARFDPPRGRWSVLGLRDGLRLVGQAPGGELSISRIDAVTGEVGPAQAMVPQPLMTGRVLHRPLLLALGITALMVIFLFKPGAAAPAVTLPPGVVVLGVLPRLGAVFIDLAVSAAAALVVCRCPLVELIWWPLWTPDLAASVPSLVMIGLTVAHSTITELAASCTLGKKLAGARVVGADGARPGAGAIIVRNALKAVVLLIPVLAVFALLHPHLQGLGDQVARTVVVRVPAGGDGPPPDDR